MRNNLRVATAVPFVGVGDIPENERQILELWRQANAQKAALVVFPELSLTSYTLKDLARDPVIIEESLIALGNLLKVGGKENLQTVALIGMPISYGGDLYNCAVAIQGNKILLAAIKSYLPNYKEFIEKREHSPAENLYDSEGGENNKLRKISLLGRKVPFGTNILLTARNVKDCTIGIEICEDMWVQNSPSSFMVNSGATVIANLSASNLLSRKAEKRENIALDISERGKCCYIFTAAGPGESPDGYAWDGQNFVAFLGEIISKGNRFERKPQITFADIDLEAIDYDRRGSNTFKECARKNRKKFFKIEFNALEANDGVLYREVSQTPFIPLNVDDLSKMCWEICTVYKIAENWYEKDSAWAIRRT